MEIYSSILMLIAFAILNLYLLGIVRRYGVLKSISISDYSLKYPWRWLFEFTIILSAFSIIGNGYVHNILLQIIGGFLLTGVALFSRFKRKLIIALIHYTCAIGGFICIFMSLVPNNLEYLIITLIVLLLVILWSYKNKRMEVILWNIEITLSYMTFLSIQIINILR